MTGAAAAVEVSVAGGDAAAAREKLRRAREMVPCLVDLRASIGPDTDPDLLPELLQEVAGFKALT